MLEALVFCSKQMFLDNTHLFSDTFEVSENRESYFFNFVASRVEQKWLSKQGNYRWKTEVKEYQKLC